MLAFIPYNLRRLVDFSGRQTRAMFWPYVGVLYLAMTLASFIAMIPPIFDMVARMQQFAREHPDQVTEVRTATSYSMTINGNHPELMPDFEGFMLAMAAITAIFYALIAAAVVRRLHDRDRAGWSGLLPLPFLFGGFIGLQSFFAGGALETPDLTAFFMLFVNNLIYLATLIYLVVLLAKSGTPGANRYGPPPAPVDANAASPRT